MTFLNLSALSAPSQVSACNPRTTNKVMIDGTYVSELPESSSCCLGGSILFLPLRFDLCQIFSCRIVRVREGAGMGWDLMSISFVR